MHALNGKHIPYALNDEDDDDDEMNDGEVDGNDDEVDNDAIIW